MRHFLTIGLVSLVAFSGCARPEPPKGAAPVKVAVAPVSDKADDPKTPVDEKQPSADPAKPQIAAPAPTDQEKYEAALSDGLVHMADQKWSDALLSFQLAQRYQDTEFVRGEIVKLKQRAEQEVTAQKTAADIEKILDEGKADEAAKLAQQALREYGDGDVSDRLVKLRLQADALQAAGMKEAAAARHQRYRDEAEAALREQNLRAAALAFEQATQAQADARLQAQLDEVRGKLQKYDAGRRRAAELRRDPQQLEDAIAALQDAAKAWDTLQVRQELDEYSLALQKRRDNVSVADFEVRGSVGAVDAGSTIAEELLPHFKSRFDLVERSQVEKVVAELKLEDSFADDPDQQRELSRLAKVRYLVLGSVSRLSGITVSARLVDARTGLVVQTAKITAPSIEQAVTHLPELARQLMMSDEEKIAYDEQQARVAQKIAPPPDDAPLPPPPAAPQPNVVVVAPPPAEVIVPAFPGYIGVTIEHFRRLPPPPAVIVKVAPPPPEPIVKHRLLHATLGVGDDLYARGRYAEAQRHFEFALNLSPGNFDLRLRLERTRPHVPPPPVVIVEPVAPVVFVRHRVAILDFATYGDPRMVPPGLGPWTAYHLSPYFRARYEVVDPAEVYWYMGRMGMTMRDLLEDPGARRWLGRALGVRYFVVGTLVETASFNVDTYMLDAEFGYLYSSARVHVRNPMELKLRLGELAQLTMIDPAERARMLAEADRFNGLVLSGRQSMDRRDFSVAIGIFENALKLRPGHVEVMVHLTNCRRQADLFALEEARRQAYLRQQALAEAAARRQWELARAAEIARARAAQQAALMVEADRRALEEQRLRAHQNLMVQARFAIQTKNFSLAFDFFKGAADIVPAQTVVVGYTPQQELMREMALARAESERAAKVQAAQAAAAREAALRQQREKELLATREKLAREQQAAAAQKKAQEERDRLLYQSSFDEGQRLYAQGNYEGALSALQAARRVKPTPVVEKMINQTLQQITLASAKGDTERQQLEAKLAAERERTRQAELEAKRNQELYQAALGLANRALEQRQYDIAQSKYEEARKLFATDAVATGLQRVKTARAAELQKAQAEAEKGTRVKQFVAAGKSAYDAKDYAKALKSYQQAKALAPGDVEVLAGLTQAESAQAKLSVDAKRQVEEAARQKEFQRLLQSGQANLKAKQYAAAVVALSEAVKLNPTDKTAAAALKSAEDAQKTASVDTKVAAETKKKTEAYQKLIADGRRALDAKRYDDAIQAFSEAQKVLPGDQTSAGFLKDAQQAKSDAAAAVAAAAKKRAEELQRAKDVQALLSKGRSAMVGGDLASAGKLFDQASQLAPTNAQVQLALKDLGTARAEATARKERAAQVQVLLTSSQTAIKKKDFDAAQKALTQAQKLAPDDAAVTQALRDLAAARKTADVAEQRDEDFQKLMVAGQKAMQAKNYKAAVQVYQQAAKLKPGDPQVTNQLEIAQRELRRVNDATADYDAAIALGQKALAGKKYAEAIKSFQEAAKLMPGDPRAAALLQQAQKAAAGEPKSPEPPTKKKVVADPPTFQELFQDGQKALQAKKYQEAVKAFGDAQKLRPNDADTAKLLKQAQKLLNDSKTADPKKKTSWLEPRQVLPSSITSAEQAIQNAGTTTRNVDYSGSLAEDVLLANVAARVGAAGRRLRLGEIAVTDSLSRKRGALPIFQ